MRILLDNCVSRKFGLLLNAHDVVHARSLGWAELQNGDLIRAAESGGFDVFLTVDKNLQYQQNLRDRKIAILVVSPLFIVYGHLLPLLPQVERALEIIAPGDFVVIQPQAI